MTDKKQPPTFSRDRSEEEYNTLRSELALVLEKEKDMDSRIALKGAIIAMDLFHRMVVALEKIGAKK